MREIRFRGKCIEDCELKGQWLYGHYLKSASHFIAVDQGLVDGHFKLYQVDPETVGQYTGLKDRIGREIYEGDIVLGYYYDTFSKKGIEIISYVRWDESGYWTFDGERRFCGGYLTDVKDIRVAGNIYDNAKLLKGEESE